MDSVPACVRIYHIMLLYKIFSVYTKVKSYSVKVSVYCIVLTPSANRHYCFVYSLAAELIGYRYRYKLPENDLIQCPFTLAYVV